MHKRKAGIESEEDRGFQPCVAKKEETDIAAYAPKKNETDKNEEMDEESAHLKRARVQEHNKNKSTLE